MKFFLPLPLHSCCFYFFHFPHLKFYSMFMVPCNFSLSKLLFLLTFSSFPSKSFFILLGSITIFALRFTVLPFSLMSMSNLRLCAAFWPLSQRADHRLIKYLTSPFICFSLSYLGRWESLFNFIKGHSHSGSKHPSV